MSVTHAHSPTAGDPADSPSVRAEMIYLADTHIKPVTYNPPQGAGLPRREGNYGAFEVRIRDARPIAGALSLDREGFVLAPHETAVSDFFDDDEVRRVYYPEVEALLKRRTGAAAVTVFDHTVRVADRAVERGLRGPVRTVHNDYTETSGPQRVRDLLAPAEAEARLKRRFAEFNVWRPITGPVRMSPLGLVDAASIAPEDLAVCDLVYADRTGEIHIGVHNPGHRWFYFPLMERDETVIIKCYDSERDGRARFSLHSAFDDPETPPDAPPRESIEVRAFAFFDD